MITKYPLRKDNFRKNVIFTNSAREGWEMVLKSLLPSSRILLPSYIGVSDREGSGIYDPVISVSVAHDFYKLNKDLSISINEIEKHIEQQRYDLILLVHYFGFKIENISEVVRLCQEQGIVVVEDCAHLYNFNLYDYSSAGTYGDYAFYSLHKNFPLKEGGMLVTNRNVLGVVFTKDSLSTIEAEVLAYNAKAIVEKRIENYNIIDGLLSNVFGITALKTLKIGDIPNTYPVIVNNDLREKLYFFLVQGDMHVFAIYYQLIEPLKTPRFTEMLELSDSILNLPVHQDVDKTDLLLLINRLKEFYEQR